MDAIGSENARGLTRKIPALEAAVVADGHRLRAALRLDPVSNTLRRLTDDPDVHAVRAGAQHTAQSSRTELKCYSEAVLDGLVVPCDVAQLLVQIKILEVRSSPAFILVLIHR